MRYLFIATAILLSFAGQASAEDSKSILAELDHAGLRTAQGQARDSDASRFLEAIADAYKVSDPKQLEGRLSVALITDTQLGPGTRFYVFAAKDEHHSAASTLKVALLARLLSELEARKLGTKWGMDGTDWGPIARRMIAQSDNAAANRILNRYGVEGMNGWLAGLGFSSSELSFGREFQGAPTPNGKDNYATAAGLAKLFFLLAQSEDVDGLLKSGMLWKAQSMLDSTGGNNNPQFNDRLNAQFPKGVAFLHKTGSNAAVLGDGGIVRDGEREYIIVAFDTKSDRKAMQRLGRNLFDLMAGE